MPDTAMHAADLLAELGQALGLPRLTLSAMGTATLVVDDDLAVNLEVDADAGTLWAYAALGEPPAQGREALYARLLQANLFGQGSGGGAVALDAGRNELLIHRGLALEHTDAQGLESALAELIAAARRVRAAWSEAPSGGQAAAPWPGADHPLPLAGLLRA
jgi:hypothetical protein